MLSGLYKRKIADARSREWRRRFYKMAATATVLYVGLSLVTFHGHLSYLPYELSIIWAVFLFCYTSFKEVLRWNNVSDSVPYSGGIWVVLILAGAVWMIAWNLVRGWIWHLPYLSFPPDYEAATIETIVLYTLSIISSIVYKRRTIVNKIVHHKPQRKTIREEPGREATDKREFALADSTKSPKAEAMLTSTSKIHDKHSS